MGCVFCRLADEGQREFLDENSHGYIVAPLGCEDRSRLLVVPRRHAKSFRDLVNGAPALMRLLESACAMMKEATGVKSVSITLSDGEDAGQHAPHFCFTVIARPSGEPASGAGMATLLQLVNGRD